MALQNSDLFIVERAGVQYNMTAKQIKEFLGTNFIAKDIPEMESLDIEAADEIYVIDATGDPTVDSGGAKYIYDGTTFIKMAEDESFDVTIAPTNLGYIPSPEKGTVTSSTGSNTDIPLVNPENAGLATPQMLKDSHVPANKAGNNATNPINIVENTQTLSFNIGQLTSLP